MRRLPLCFALVALNFPAAAQTQVESPELSFLGLRAGMPLAEVSEVLELPKDWHTRCRAPVSSVETLTCHIGGVETRFETSQVGFMFGVDPAKTRVTFALVTMKFEGRAAAREVFVPLARHWRSKSVFLTSQDPVDLRSQDTCGFYGWVQPSTLDASISVSCHGQDYSAVFDDHRPITEVRIEVVLSQR